MWLCGRQTVLVSVKGDTDEEEDGSINRSGGGTLEAKQAHVGGAEACGGEERGTILF